MNSDMPYKHRIESGLNPRELPASRGEKGSFGVDYRWKTTMAIPWRGEFQSLNSAGLAPRLLFPLVASATLLPFVSPGIALLVGMAVALTLGNPYPLTTARFVTPLLQMSVIGLGAGMNLIEVGRWAYTGLSIPQWE